MQDIRNQRLDMLQRRDKDTHSAILWLQDNQHLFKERIFEPVSLLVRECVWVWGVVCVVCVWGCVGVDVCVVC